MNKKKEILLIAGILEAVVSVHVYYPEYTVVVPLPAKYLFLSNDKEVYFPKELVFGMTTKIKDGRRIYKLIDIKDPTPTLTTKAKDTDILKIKYE